MAEKGPITHVKEEQRFKERPSRRFDSLMPVGASLDVQPSPLRMYEVVGDQHDEMQRLVGENQRLAATQVVLREELVAARQELSRFQQSKTSDTEKEQHLTITQVALRQELADAKQDTAGLQEALRVLRMEKEQHIQALLEKDHQIRSLIDKIAHMEAEFKATAGFKPEFEKLRFERDELVTHIALLTGEARRLSVKDQEITSLKSEVDELGARFQQARMDFETQKKANNELMQQKLAAEKHAYSVSRDMEKVQTDSMRQIERLRADVTNAERRAYSATLASTGGATSHGAYSTVYGSKQDVLKVDDLLTKTADSSGDWSKHSVFNEVPYYQRSSMRTPPWDSSKSGQPEVTASQSQLQQPENFKGTNLVIDGLSEGVTDKDLAGMFEPHGSVLYAKVDEDKELGAGHYYGMVTMENLKDAEAAFAALNKSTVKGQKLKVEIQESKEQAPHLLNPYHHDGGYPHYPRMPPTMAAYYQGGIGPIRYNRPGHLGGHWPY